jgi:uncharacterized protein
VSHSITKEKTVADSAITPWYRQGWPWFLISLPAAAVIGGVITAILAVRTYDGPVTADYYKQGLAINEEVARADLARSLSLAARVELAALSDGSRVRVELESQHSMPPEAALRLRLVHPGRPGEDRSAVLARVDVDADNRRAVYVGTLQSTAKGEVGTVSWQVILESPRWRIDDSFTTGTGGQFKVRAR